MLLKIGFERCIAAEIGAAIATGVGALASSGLNAYSQHRTNAVNREQAQYAFQQQKQAIREQNEYNSPAQQVVRMMAAGLNPSLAYGADGATVGNQADVPAYNAIPAEAPNIGNLGSSLADSVRTGIEVKDLERRQALAMADIALKDAYSFQAVTQSELNLATKIEILSLMGYKMDLMSSEIDLNEQNIRESDERIKNLMEERNEILSRIGLNEQQVKTLAAQAHLSEAQAYAILQRLPSEILALDAQSALNAMQTDVAREQVFQIRRDVEHIGWSEEFQRRQFNTDLKKWNIEQKKWFEEQKQNRRLHMIDGLTNIISFTNSALLLRGAQGSKGNGFVPADGTGGKMRPRYQ